MQAMLDTNFYWVIGADWFNACVRLLSPLTAAWMALSYGAQPAVPMLLGYPVKVTRPGQMPMLVYGYPPGTWQPVPRYTTMISDLLP